MGRQDRKQTREIDGWTYEVTPVDFPVGQKALLRFMRIAAPVFKTIQQTAAGNGGMEKAALAAIELLPALVTDEDIDYFTKIFGPETEAIGDGKQYFLDAKNQAAHFDGRYAAFFLWLGFCIEVNFAGFFGVLMRRGKTTEASTPSTASASTPTSGSSGES